MLSLPLDSETEWRLEDLARATGRARRFCAREALLLRLEQMEDRYIPIQRLEEPDVRVSLEEIEDHFDLS